MRNKMANAQAVQQNWIEARDIQIDDADTYPNNWSWIRLSKGEMAGLEGDSALDIQGRIPSAQRHENNFATWHPHFLKKKKKWIGAGDLQIKDADNENRWSWNILPEGEVARLIGNKVLDIQGKTPRTKVNHEYRAYLVFKIEPNHNNIDNAYSTIGDGNLRLISLARNPLCRSDGWSEVALGDFQGTGSQLNIRVRGIDNHHLKHGLIVKGVEVRKK